MAMKAIRSNQSKQIEGGAMFATQSTQSGQSASRGMQLIIGIVCMAMIANLQYGWTLFVNPIGDKFGWTKAAIQVTFSIFVLTETWLVPVEGYLVDKFGPKIITVIGGVLVGISWAMNAYANSLMMFYVAAAIGGIGAGAVYGTCVGNALKWFPDRRGLAAGLTAMGFGAGSALTIIPISAMIKSSGYETTFLAFGIGQGIVVFLLGWLLRAPTELDLRNVPKTSLMAAAPVKDYQWYEMIQTPVFWLLYAMFVMMAAGGLMATAQLAPIAKDFHVADIPVNIFGLTLPALTFALSLDRILNGVTRPFFGWVSDRIGRENTMFIAFMLEGIGILALSRFGTDPLAFVLLSAVVFFGWGEIYSLFPSTCGDTYGAKYATTNAGLLYTAKGTAAALVPFTSVLAANGNWHTVFYCAAALNILAALAAILLLKPMRAAMGNRAETMQSARQSTTG
jgi:OFA family oxalate/formate antiporter-like MFS transporter